MALRALALASVAGVASSLTYVEYPFDGSTTTGWVEESDNCCSGSVSTSGTTLTVSSSERVYLVGDVSSAFSWGGLSYDKLNLLGKTLSWTQDTSKIGCGCNAALYLVSMDAPSSSGSEYCDIQETDGSACLEIDLFEGSRKAFQSTIHTSTGTGSDGTCNQWGCYANWGKDSNLLYGASGSKINSDHAFTVEASFANSGAMTITLEQDGKTHAFYNASSAGNPTGTGVSSAANALVKTAMKNGMVLVVSLWTADDMSWLDGGCDWNIYPTCSLDSASIVFSDLVVTHFDPSSSDDDDGGTPVSDDNGDATCVADWAKCGGTDWDGTVYGPFSCCSGATCYHQSESYYQCTP